MAERLGVYEWERCVVERRGVCVSHFTGKECVNEGCLRGKRV